ncbi:MAG: DUF1552 domain-containing protein [Verrucomicrobiota bacterium]
MAPLALTPPDLTRRSFLRSAGVTLALPFLEALAPRFARASSPASPPRRMVCIMTNTGLIPDNFFPKATGFEYETTRYLAHLEEHRKNLTVIGGVSHPDNSGGHMVEKSFLTGARFPSSPSFKNSISLDQIAAEHIGHLTRFPFLALGVNEKHDGLLSVTRDGVFIPPEFSPSKLYNRLFTADTEEESESRLREIRNQTSLLDFVNDKAKRLEKLLGQSDRDRLDQYFTSVRELEQRLQHAEKWQRREKPQTSTPAPRDISDITQDKDRAALMYDMARLALESDSTRLITIYLNPLEVTLKLPGVHDRTHSLTHHGNEPEKLEQLAKIEEAGIQNLSSFLSGLSSVKEGDQTLLDQTMVLFGSNMASGNSHSNTNLPILLAGGGFKHGQHLQFDLKQNAPLCNVFVSMLQRMGIETDKFASSTGTLTGLDLL